MSEFDRISLSRVRQHALRQGVKRRMVMLAAALFSLVYFCFIVASIILIRVY